MTSQDFVNLVYAEKRYLLRLYETGEATHVKEELGKLNLTPTQTGGVFKVLDMVLTDAYYTMLLGLDGSAQLGGQQINYELKDEQGNILTGGNIEGAAYEKFHGAE